MPAEKLQTKLLEHIINIVQRVHFKFVFLFRLRRMEGLCEVCTKWETRDHTGLFKAVENGHLKCVEVLIRKGANVNKQYKNTNEGDKYYSTSLTLAAQNGYDKFVELLTKAGADVNMKDTWNWTALMWASVRGYNKCIDLLIQAGADVNQGNGGNWTPLMKAAMSGRGKCIDILIEAGADVNKLECFDRTALMFAAIKGQYKCFDALVRAGVDVNKQNKDGCTALMMPKMRIYQSVRQCLIAGAQINLVDKDGRNALTRQLMKEDPSEEVIMLLYATGETIDETKVQVPDYLKPPELNLKHLTMEAIRKHLINIDPHQHLFGRIPQLGLPPSLTKYLLYNVSLDDE